MEFKLVVVGNAGVGKTAVTAWLAGLPGWNRLDHAHCCGGAGLSTRHRLLQNVLAPARLHALTNYFISLEINMTSFLQFFFINSATSYLSLIQRTEIRIILV